MPALTSTKRLSQFALGTWFAFAWSWVLFTDSLDLAGSKSQGMVVAIVVLVINVALSVVVMWNTFRLVRWIFKRYDYLPAIIVALPLLAVADFFISWITAIIWIGPQGSIDNILPLSSPTLVAINTPFGFAARLIGFSGLAAFLWLIVFMLATKKLRPHVVVPLAGLSILAFLGCALYRAPTGGTFRATIVAESVDERVAPLDPANTNLVVFPEYGFNEITSDSLNSRIRMNDPTNTNKHFFIGSEQVRTDKKSGHHNQLIFGDTIDGITQKQDKYRLIPGGEDLAYTARQALRLSGQQSTLDYFTYVKETTKGTNSLVTFKTADGIIGAAVCSSIIAPQDYRQFARNGATVLTNSASLTIFKGSPVFSWQQRSLSRFMAVSNARYFLQSANGASAYALDTNGNMIAKISPNNTATLQVTNNTTKTLYTYLGEWTVCAGVITGGWLLYQYRRPKTSKKRTHKK